MSLDRETYPRLYNALATPDTVLELDDVADDVAVEQETLTSGSPEVPANSSASTGITDGLSSLQETLKHVLKGILDSTESEYKRYAFVSLIYVVPLLDKLQVNLKLQHLPEGVWPPSGW
jgi:hypothetical protein